MNIGIVGCAGRMGRALLAAVHDAPDSHIAGGTDVAESGWVGRDLGEVLGREAIGLAVGDDARALFTVADAVIDFTSPKATVLHARLAAETRTVWVLGTTGTSAAGDAAVADAATKTAVVRAANMSVGVNLLIGLARKAAAALDTEFDAEILEFHHKHKVDAPSGTALALGAAIADARGQDHDKVKVLGRHGVTGERRRGEIGYAVLRGGNVIGDHTVVFAGESERIELVHRAGSRDIFARGALRAAHWAHGKPPGLYGMADVLGLTD
ncbi:MAG: 4-hydroxy-tetrahydrodipicolinate reductase [Proteobacteria bacterium]|nr:4-hydroxy-tetrahydrodipicolinate reductase [Pseudomonadota bacterium]MDA1132119.1 4-hydroxy-tetrahydrodipicolinate reductase [Pseudomonadota bacterium]